MGDSGLVVTTEDIPTAEVWPFGRHTIYTLLNVYANEDGCRLYRLHHHYRRRLGILPRWLTVLGLTSGVVLLLTAGLIPWIELASQRGCSCSAWTSWSHPFVPVMRGQAGRDQSCPRWRAATRTTEDSRRLRCLVCIGGSAATGVRSIAKYLVRRGLAQR